MVDTAVMMATGGNTLRAIGILRHAGDLPSLSRWLWLEIHGGIASSNHSDERASR